MRTPEPPRNIPGELQIVGPPLQRNLSLPAQFLLALVSFDVPHLAVMLWAVIFNCDLPGVAVVVETKSVPAPPARHTGAPPRSAIGPFQSEPLYASRLPGGPDVFVAREAHQVRRVEPRCILSWLASRWHFIQTTRGALPDDGHQPRPDGWFCGAR